ncbi:MAG TPA: 4Fe-4S binding protein, partial [Anaerolineales bacterium]|nr:4Fe-4S binding protein [Anaerolineales bacterium]
VQATIGLIILSLIKPVQSAAPADLSTLVASTPMDAYYLGFLPLIDAWGNLIFWGLAILLGGTLILLPWLASGRDLGPALVTDPKCTGCNICYAECPFDAIRMVPRDDDSGYPRLAIINNAQCTGCGICVGSCPTDAIDMAGGYNNEQVINAIKGALHREKNEGKSVTVLFASHRDEALGGLPARLNASGENAPIAVSAWGTNEAARVITAVLPSASAVNIEWIKQLENEGARDIVILAHPYDDGVYREDAHWIASRLHLRPALVREGLHWLETTPGDAKAVETFLNDLHKNQNGKRPPALPPVKERDKLIPSLVSGLFGTILLLGMFALALPLDIPTGMKAAEGSALRVAVDARGKISSANIPSGVTLPEGADAEKIFGGTHFPISVQVFLNGEVILDETYQPSGLSGNGRISALEFLEIAPGVYQVEVLMKDDDGDFRITYAGEVNFEKGRTLILAYEENRDEFVLR